jgi:hypothetical protein
MYVSIWITYVYTNVCERFDVSRTRHFAEAKTPFRTSLLFHLLLLLFYSKHVT